MFELLASPQVQEFVLTAQQILWLNIIAVLVVQLIVIFWVKVLKKAKPTETAIKFIVFVVSLPLAYFWYTGGKTLPSVATDPMTFAIELLTLVLTIFILAQVIYDKLIDFVLDGLDKYLIAPLVGAGVTETVEFLRPHSYETIEWEEIDPGIKARDASL